MKARITDLFTDTAAILKLLDFRSIIRGMPREALAQCLHALFGQKENFTVYFSGNRRSLLHPNTAQRSFFSHYKLFLGKFKGKLAQKAWVNTEHPIMLVKSN